MPKQPGVSASRRLGVSASRSSSGLGSRILTLAALWLGILSAPLSAQDRNFTRRVSLDGSGGALGASSQRPRVTPDGKYLVFSTSDDILGLSTPSGVLQVYRKDLSGGASGTVVLVSVDDDDDPSPSDCVNPSISNDGLRVAFETQASLVTDDGNSFWDVYLRVLNPGNESTRIVSCRATSPNGDSRFSFLAGDGDHVVFTSTATNIPDVTDTNGALPDVLRVSLDTTDPDDPSPDAWDIVSLDNSGAQSSESSTGWHTGDTTRVGRVVSDDGRFVAMVGEPCDWDGCSLGNCLEPGNSCSTSHAQLYIRDVDPTSGPAKTYRVSRDAVNSTTFNPANADVRDFTLGADGRLLAFSTTATNLPGDSDSSEDVFIFFADTPADFNSSSKDPKRISPATSGTPNGDSSAPVVSGVFVAFESTASNLISSDTNSASDIFFVVVVDPDDLTIEAPRRFSVGVSASSIPLLQTNGGSTHVDLGLDEDQQRIAAYYESTGTNLIASDSNGVGDVFETFERGFKRGDADGDGTLEGGTGPDSDYAFLVAYLYSGGDDLACFETGDANDDGSINVSDVAVLGQTPPTVDAPSCASATDVDPTDDEIGCNAYVCP